MTDEELLDRLQNCPEFNPWLEVADRWLDELEGGSHKGDFTHPNDENKIELYNTKLNDAFPGKRSSKRLKNNSYRKNQPTNADLELILNLLPQPFIGDPRSPIWILLRNPGYSAIDVYDLTSIPGGKNAIKKEGLISVRDLRFHNQGNENQVLLQRQQLVCRQLKFDLDEGKEFYILRDKFNTLELKEGHNRSRKVLGGYNWYDKYLFPENGCLSRFSNRTSRSNRTIHLKIASKRIFVLEYDPYHSRAYFESNVDFAHHILWKNLIEYGIKSKIIIVRGRDILDHIRESISSDDLFKTSNERRLFVFKGQSASMSINNMYWPCLNGDPSNPLARQ